MLGALSKIEKLLDHGEKIELVVDKTENLRFQEDSFQHQGKQLRRKLWLQSVKIKLAKFSITFLFIVEDDKEVVKAVYAKLGVLDCKYLDKAMAEDENLQGLGIPNLQEHIFVGAEDLKGLKMHEESHGLDVPMHTSVQAKIL
ncbi:hypothetical protein L7F22_024444 [Adiantum nelumboides]|nr:hypothetical protein [Adiantum nelumboides]